MDKAQTWQDALSEVMTISTAKNAGIPLETVYEAVCSYCARHDIRPPKIQNHVRRYLIQDMGLKVQFTDRIDHGRVNLVFGVCLTGISVEVQTVHNKAPRPKVAKSEPILNAFKIPRSEPEPERVEYEKVKVDYGAFTVTETIRRGEKPPAPRQDVIDMMCGRPKTALERHFGRANYR